MKKFSFLMAALLVAMTGCQKEPQVTENGSDAQTVGYVSLKISLPKDKGTKATSNENKYYSGSEYTVNDATAVFYDENGNYVYHTSISTTLGQMNSSNNITATGKTEPIGIRTAEKTLYALVLVNTEGLYAYPEGTSFENFNYINQDILNVEALTGKNKDDFFMSNAPYYENGVYKTLVPVSVEKTADDAAGNAASIDVERAVARVSVDWHDALQMGDGADMKGWGLDITNKVFYPVRRCYAPEQTANDWPVDGTLFGAIWDGERVNMAIDPNYSKQWSEDEMENGGWIMQFNRVDVSKLNADGSGQSYEYCMENTFNIDCMRENQTTSVILKVGLTPNFPEGIYNGETWFMVGESKAIMTVDQLAEYIVETAAEYYTAHGWNVADMAAEGITTEAIKNHNWMAGNNDMLFSEESGVSSCDVVGDIICYLEGVCYYSVPIRHFNDEELGYDSSDKFFEDFDNANGYTSAHLGRYGVVRNNWYNLKIRSISGPGSPVVPNPGVGPDDETKQYVSCEINILAWRLRGQIVDL